MVIKSGKCIEYYFRREFKDTVKQGSGFSFPCKESGEIQFESEMARINFGKCVSGEYSVVDHGIVKYPYTVPAIGICEVCGEEVSLEGFTNTCSNCKADYNLWGQLLAPREQWGWDTGESLSEILLLNELNRHNSLFV